MSEAFLRPAALLRTLAARSREAAAACSATLCGLAGVDATDDAMFDGKIRPIDSASFRESFFESTVRGEGPGVLSL